MEARIRSSALTLAVVVAAVEDHAIVVGVDVSVSELVVSAGAVVNNRGVVRRLCKADPVVASTEVVGTTSQPEQPVQLQKNGSACSCEH